MIHTTSPERGGGPRASVAEGFAVRRIPIGMHQGESVEALLASPGGVAERSESFNNNGCRWQSYLDPIAVSLDGSSEPARLTEEGWRQPRYCLHFVQWYQSRLLQITFSLFRFIYHMENGSYKTSTFLHSPNPLSSFRCTPSLISHAPLGRASFPPGEAKGDGTNSPGIS